MMTRRLNLTLGLPAALSLLTLGACDLEDKSLGDTGADETIGGETETASDSDPSGDPTSDSSDPTADPTSDPTSDPSDPTGLDCTEIGCSDGLALTILSADSFVDGNYQIQVFDEEMPAYSCDFGLQGGSLDDADCDIASVAADALLVNLPLTGADVTINVLIDEAYAAGGEFGLVYEDVQPNGPGCEPICSQASAELAMGSGDPGETCDDLEVAFAAEFEAVRGCKDANECGQVLSGFSCGCTRDWVGRLDSDPETLYQVAEDAQTLECEWAGWGGPCDCPETDGFACIDNICQWNYIAGE